MISAGMLLITRHEMLQILKLRSFWLTLLILPVALALGPLFSKVVDREEPIRVTIIDRSANAAGAAVTGRFAQDDTHYLMRQLARYVRRHGLAQADSTAVWAQQKNWYSPADIAAFTAAGGLPAALAQIERVRPKGVPRFDPPVPDYRFQAPPAELRSVPAANFAAAARAILDRDKAGDRPEIVVLIPAGYPADPRIAIYTANEVQGSFVRRLQEVLTGDLRSRALAAAGVAGQRAAVIEGMAPVITIDTPPPGGGARETLVVRSIVPMALAYILMMSLLLSGSWMLQGSVEERSNKLIESLLACITPEELLYGKLLGGLSVGLMMLVVWAGCAGVAAYATQGFIADLIRPALEPVSSPGIIAAIVFFFVAGYISISAIFVAIGAMVDSMSEAQGFMMPVLFLILLPISLLLTAIMAGNNGPIVQILTWVPIWTPFAVLARLGLGIATWELIGAGLVLTVAIAAELVMIARLFRASLLATGQKLTLASLLQRLRRTG